MTQAELHMRTILENLGYLSPTFEYNDNRLSIRTGPRTTIQSLNVEGDKDELDASKKRKVIGAPLTSNKLDEVSAWANQTLRSRGYACPNVKVEAHQWDASVWIKADTGPKQTFSELKLPDLLPVQSEVFERYKPFDEGDAYDVRKTQIMTARLLNDGLVQSAYFLTNCQTDKFLLELEATFGKPKMIRVEVGASTEELPFINVTYRNSHLDDLASSVTATFHASPILQNIVFGSEIYLFDDLPVFIGPRFRAEREDERLYQIETARTGVDIGRNWDLWQTRFVAKWGPTWNYLHTRQGGGPEEISFLTFDGMLSMMSHTYEALIWQQYSGWTATAIFRGQRKGAESQINLNRYDFTYKQLWNLGNYSPPLLVLGARAEAITVATEDLDDSDSLAKVPIDARVFAGGDRNLRGFPRKGLDNGGRGYLTFAYIGFELRLIEQLPHNFQPLVLFDIGRLGARHDALEDPVYSSSGVGFRWPTKFGLFYGTAARGRIQNENPSTRGYPQEWVYFLSYGQGF